MGLFCYFERKVFVNYQCRLSLLYDLLMIKSFEYNAKQLYYGLLIGGT